MTIRAKALDSLRGLLPAATRSNVGIFGTGQGYEALLLRMRAHPLREVRDYADLMLAELRRSSPPSSGASSARSGAVSGRATSPRPRGDGAVAARLLDGVEPEPRARGDAHRLRSRTGGEGGRRRALRGVRAARRPAPGRGAQARAGGAAAVLRGVRRAAGEPAPQARPRLRAHRYRFDVLGDYGAFRDLQRHRLLTLEWQPLSPATATSTPDEFGEAGPAADWTRVMEESAALHDALAGGRRAVAPYAVAMAYRVRFYMELNAREAMHMIELRTAPQGHPAYRRICQADAPPDRGAGRPPRHRGGDVHVDHSGGEGGRLGAELAAERRRDAAR